MSLATTFTSRLRSAVPSARIPGRRAVVEYDAPRYAARGRDALAGALVSTRLGERFRAGDLTDKQRRRLVGSLIRDARADLDALARRLDEGSLSLASWHRKSAELLATAHHAAAMAGLGRSGLDAAERADVHATLRRELGYLARFRGELQAGLVDTGAMAAARARMYGSALWGGAEESRRSGMIREGYGFEKRVLGSPERSCSACPDLAAMGWVRAGTLPRIGDTPCKTNCRCSFSYRRSLPGEAGASGPVVEFAEGGAGRGRILAEASAILGRPASESDLAALVGAPADGRVVASMVGPGRLLLSLSGGPEDGGYSADRALHAEEDDAGRAYAAMTNVYFEVFGDDRGKGLGASIFGRQVEHAARLGVREIRAEAAGRGPGLEGTTSDLNGYYTWPRFGYDAPIPREFVDRIGGELPDDFPGATRVSDLMRSADGRDLWRIYGVASEMTFDLRPGSISRVVWDAYRAEKARREGPR